MWMNWVRLNILATFALALLLSACGKELPFYEQTTTPLRLEMSYGDINYSIQNNDFSTGKIRYIIRTFPVGAIYSEVDPIQEFIIVKDLKDSLDHVVTLDFRVGSYDVIVWSDLIKAGEEKSCYDADNFGRVTLDVGRTGNNEYRNAFRGFATVEVSETDEPDVLEVEMESPMARFELVSNDLEQFVGGHTRRAGGESILKDYKAVIYYTGFMPYVFSLYTDKPVDSTNGVMFEASLTQLSDTEVRLGYDYVFVGEKTSAVTVRVGVYDAEGNQVSMSAPAKVSLRRGRCSVKTGNFLTSKSSLDGIYIDKEFEGSFDIEL